MKKSINILMVLSFSILLLGCSSSTKKEGEKPADKENIVTPKSAESNQSFSAFIPSIVKIESYDKDRFLNSEIAFFVGKQEVVCRLSMLENANVAKVIPFNENKKYTISGYLAIDRINDLVLLKVEGVKRKPIQLYSGIAPINTKSLYLTKPQSNTLPIHRGSVLSYSTIAGVKRYTVDNQFYSKSFGSPVFTSNRQCIGLGYSEVVNYENQGLAIPSIFISALLNKQEDSPKKLEGLKSKTSQATSEANSKIKGLVIQTDYGDIQIRLFNETPEYRDNFIRLVREDFYDSLLIHRVIKGFGIQSGAADTRYADKDDVVGWKGPWLYIAGPYCLNVFSQAWNDWFASKT